jgi:hypothetical protein
MFQSPSPDVWRRDTPEMVAAALKDIPAAGPGPFQESWDSIQQNYKDPDWFRDGKFGIYMHWGIYSVPAHGSEWYVRYMYGGNKGVMDWHTEHFGPPTKFGYKDFLPMFTAAQVGSGRLGGPVQECRREICLCSRRASRRLFQLGQQGQSIQRQKLRPAPGSGRRPHRSSAKSRPEDRHLGSFLLSFPIHSDTAARQRFIEQRSV